MTDNQPLIHRLVPGYQGVVQNWECDLMGHLNISFYFGRASDQAFFLRHALKLSPEEMRAHHRGTVALEEHVRFHKEAAAGTMMVGRSAPIEIGDKTMTIYQEFRDQDDNLQCTFKTLFGHFDTANRKLVAWRDETRAAVQSLRIDLPPLGAAKFVASNGRVEAHRRDTLPDAGFTRCGGAAINSWECDQFGHMNTMFYVRRLGEAAPHMWHAKGVDLQESVARGRGAVVGEMCVSYVGEVLAGDMVETYSTISEVDEKSVLAEHRMFNAATGALSALARLRILCFDLTARRAAPWPDDILQKLTS